MTPASAARDFLGFLFPSFLSGQLSSAYLREAFSS
jgi:hypothetical protein